MAQFIVDSNGDTENANDNLTTLREAIAMAAGTSEADTIVFADAITTVALENFLTLAAGQDIVIDGDRDDDGVADVTLNGGQTTYHFDIATDAVLTLIGLNLTNGFGQAAGSIVNNGDLSLIRTLIDASRAEGENGAAGGPGGSGSPGRNGDDGGGIAEQGDPGGDGTNGATGGVGTPGAPAAGGIFNSATGNLTLVDSAVGPDVMAEPGDGGDGGRGGNGGRGGSGGDGSNGFSPGLAGGNGGSGGNGGDGGRGGNGGNGGNGANGILNLGSVTVETAFAVAATATFASEPGAGGPGGSGGAIGNGGQGGGGFLAPQGADGADGQRGQDGGPGDPGLPGTFSAQIGGEGGVQGSDQVFESIVFLSAPEGAATSGGVATFNVSRLGVDTAVTTTIEVTDSEGSVVGSQTVNFTAGGPDGQSVSVGVGGAAAGLLTARLTEVDNADVGIGTDLVTIANEVDPDIGQGLTVGEAQVVAYLYEGALDRDGNIDLPGLNFWIDRREGPVDRNGQTLPQLDETELAQRFLAAPEFEENFGEALDPTEPDYLSDDSYVETLYQNLLNRGSDAAGFGFWFGRLQNPDVERNDILLAFVTSEENTSAEILAFVENLTEVSPGEWDFVG